MWIPVCLAKEHSLGRLDTNLSYYKSNCKWMTTEELSSVRNNVLKITHKDLTLTTKEWSDIMSLRPNSISSKLNRGWTVEEALGLKVKTKHQLITCQGRTLSIKEWSELRGISIDAIKSKIRRSWSISQALGYGDR